MADAKRAGAPVHGCLPFALHLEIDDLILLGALEDGLHQAHQLALLVVRDDRLGLAVHDGRDVAVVVVMSESMRSSGYSLIVSGVRGPSSL